MPFNTLYGSIKLILSISEKAIALSEPYMPLNALYGSIN